MTDSRRGDTGKWSWLGRAEEESERWAVVAVCVSWLYAPKGIRRIEGLSEDLTVWAEKTILIKGKFVLEKHMGYKLYCKLVHVKLTYNSVHTIQDIEIKILINPPS